MGTEQRWNYKADDGGRPTLEHLFERGARNRPTLLLGGRKAPGKAGNGLQVDHDRGAERPLAHEPAEVTIGRMEAARGSRRADPLAACSAVDGEPVAVAPTGRQM